jgi:hypothetical protein
MTVHLARLEDEGLVSNALGDTAARAERSGGPKTFPPMSRRPLSVRHMIMEALNGSKA